MEIQKYVAFKRLNEMAPVKVARSIPQIKSEIKLFRECLLVGKRL